jgi:hypothetical protein
VVQAWAKSLGVRPPWALCGRCWLYSMARKERSTSRLRSATRRCRVVPSIAAVRFDRERFEVRLVGRNVSRSERLEDLLGFTNPRLGPFQVERNLGRFAQMEMSERFSHMFREYSDAVSVERRPKP